MTEGYPVIPRSDGLVPFSESRNAQSSNGSNLQTKTICYALTVNSSSVQK